MKVEAKNVKTHLNAAFDLKMVLLSMHDRHPHSTIRNKLQIII